MDWNLAIAHNHEALKRILAMLVAMVGLESAFSPPACRPPSAPPQGRGSAAATLPRHLHRAVLRLLRPAESAVRRLIIVMARGLPATPPARPHAPKPAPICLRKPGGTGILPPHGARPGPPAGRTRALPLLDPLRSPFQHRRPAASGVPRISLPGFTRPFPIVVRPPPASGDLVDATRLTLRLRALERALDDLPGHARRFARWRDRVAAGRRIEDSSIAADAQNPRSRVATSAQNGKPRGKIVRSWPLRMGRPPGWRRKGAHEVYGVLADTNGLAIWALEARDTS